MRLITLIEGRDATLYHGTSVVNFFAIMKQNALVGYDSNDGLENSYPSTIRLSRNFETADRFAHVFNTENVNGAGVILALDQAKLSQRYKMFPYHDQKMGITRQDKESEAEEVLVADVVQNLDRYLIEFHCTAEEISRVLDPEDQKWNSYLFEPIKDWSQKEIQAMAEHLTNHPLRKGN